MDKECTNNIVQALRTDPSLTTFRPSCFKSFLRSMFLFYFLHILDFVLLITCFAVTVKPKAQLLTRKSRETEKEGLLTCHSRVGQEPPLW